MKLDVMRPRVVVDINPLTPMPGRPVDLTTEICGSARWRGWPMSAANPDIQRNYPVIAESLKLAASPQLRNMATLGGNVLQRTRCTYFRDVSYERLQQAQSGLGLRRDWMASTARHAVLGTIASSASPPIPAISRRP